MYQIYLSPQGNDQAAGTGVAPLQTVAAALRAAREFRRLQQLKKGGASIAVPIEILLEDGVYTPDMPLLVRAEDGGGDDNGVALTLRAVHPGKAVISGGLQVKGWQLLSKEQSVAAGLPAVSYGKVYVADLPKDHGPFLNFRQCWINGRKAVRAESVNGGSSGRIMQRILSWNHQDQSCWIPKPACFDVRHLYGMEMLIHQWWATAVLRVKSAVVQGDSVQLHFLQPESKIESEHPWPAPWLSTKTGNSAFYLSNAIAFLDTAGEWYVDRAAQKLYYWPREGEDVQQAATQVIIPYLTTLLKVGGTLDRPARNIRFQGISFRYTGWLRPSLQGHVPLQAGMYLLDAYKLQQPGTPEKKSLENQAWIGRPAAGIEVRFADHIRFEDCRFEHMASTGLDFVKGTHDDTIRGNLFKDIGGTGIQIGTYADPGFETHLPYQPKDPRVLCTRESVLDNLVTDVTNEDWGCVGISAGYVKDLLVRHNEVSEVSYSGICVGWGWTKKKNAMSGNRILDNKVTHYAKRMYDVGGIYTLSAQPGSLIAGNVIDSIYKAPYPHDPDHWFYFYLDEGSSYITLKDNWCPELRVMKNANGPGNIWQDNGPGVSKVVKAAAGLEPAFRYLLTEKVTDPGWPIQPVPAGK